MLKPLTCLALLVCGVMLLSSCSNRRAAEAQFLGTWNRDNNMDSTADLTFFPDHTFISSGESMGEYTIYDTGKWYLDYKRIFLRLNNRDEGALVVLNISDVTPHELKIAIKKDWIETYTRIKSMTREQIQGMVGKRADYTITP